MLTTRSPADRMTPSELVSEKSFFSSGSPPLTKNAIENDRMATIRLTDIRTKQSFFSSSAIFDR